MSRGTMKTSVCVLVLASMLVACGTSSSQAPDAGTDAALDAAQPRRRKLVVIFGQSNAGKRGMVADLSDTTLADPYPAIPYVSITGDDGRPPNTSSMPLGPLQPQINLGVSHFGIELSLGRTLNEADPDGWAIVTFAFGSTALGGEWNPTSNYPTAAQNLFAWQVAFVKQALIDTDSDLGGEIWIQGESDAPTVAIGQAYGIRLAEFIGAERLELPIVPFIYGRLNIHCPLVGAANVRAGQEANQTATSIMVDMDTYPLRNDMEHYSTQAVVDLGILYGKTLLEAQPPAKKAP